MELSRRSSLLVLAAGLAGAGCLGGAGDSTGPEAATDAPYDVGDTVGAGVVPDTLPATLTCVSSPVAEAEVLRANIARGPEGMGTVSLARGPQFWSHLGVWEASAEPGVVHDIVADDDGSVLVEQEGIEVRLEREGLIVRGSLLQDRADPGSAVDLTCWNQLELFGSPWAQIVGTLPAHFDWEVSTCVDGHGMPAHNDVPVELVRETGQGECADLRGEPLNGGDLSDPDLQGWSLAGARLDGASLSFAHLQGASLHGADLSGIALGYATLNGLIDASTILPREGCQVTENAWAGTFVDCVR